MTDGCVERQADEEAGGESWTGRHGDGSGLYVVVDSSGARHRSGGILGFGGADVVTLNQALEYRRMAESGLNPQFKSFRD